MKELFISEKPSVAQQFADALDIDKAQSRRNGFLETERYIVTWCVGHLVSMSYPEKYDESLKRWRLDTLPFIPEKFRYEVIDSVKNQFAVVSKLLNRDDVSTIYICTDSGREGEYIYRLVDEMAGVHDKKKLRVWIDSQTREEILRGIREAKPDSEYDNLSASAFSRAKEDYLMGINFSRALTLRYGRAISRTLGREKPTVVAAGRVMTCVLGMIVRREEEIRNFKKTEFTRVLADFSGTADGKADFSGEFRAVPESKRYRPSDLYKNNGFLKSEKAEQFVKSFDPLPKEAEVLNVERKKETKNPPLLYNLAELQNDCARLYKINPDQTLAVAQELYEKKLTTYPRTDARVLSSAVAKEIHKNIEGLLRYPLSQPWAKEILENKSFQKIGKTRYTDDSRITDHYAIIPTGQTDAARGLSPLSAKVYGLIVLRFLSVFYPPAVYQRLNLTMISLGENFAVGTKVLKDAGYLRIYQKDKSRRAEDSPRGETMDQNMENSENTALLSVRKGQRLYLTGFSLKSGETAPPKRYTSGTMILAMENAGNLIEDEELRAQIKGCGIGTSATRAGILTKLEKNGYIANNKKTQVLTPTRLGELVTKAVSASVRQLLNPELTASWEKGLSMVASGEITEEEYMEKLKGFVIRRTNAIKSVRL